MSTTPSTTKSIVAISWTGALAIYPMPKCVQSNTPVKVRADGLTITKADTEPYVNAKAQPLNAHQYATLTTAIKASAKASIESADKAKAEALKSAEALTDAKAKAEALKSAEALTVPTVADALKAATKSVLSSGRIEFTVKARAARIEALNLADTLTLDAE